MGHWTIRHCLALCIGAIILVATVACGKHHVVSTSQLATTGAQTPVISAQDSGAGGDAGITSEAALDEQIVWPSDQELIQRYIAAKAAKEIAGAPDKGASGFTALGDEVKIDDLRVEAVGDDYYLSWTYRNPGDYNLDSIVNSQDYTPLAQYFGKRVSDEAAAQIVDGNGDGIVNPADIGIIALYYQRHCSSAQLYWSPDGSSFEPIYSDSTLSRLEGEPPTCRIRIPYHHEHGWFRVAPEFSYLGEGPLSDPVQHLPVEGAPIIKSVSPYRPTVHQYDSVEFSTSFTAARPYTITWDFGEENDLLGTTSYDDEFAYAQFYKPGVNLCSLTVENAIGKATHRFVVYVESDFYTDPLVINSVNPKRSFTRGERVMFEPSGHDLYETEFYWDFGGAAEPGYSMEYKPSVVMGAPGRYYASLLVANPVGYTIYHFVINIVHGDSEVEPNNTPAQADRLPPANTFDEFISDASIGKQQASIDTADWFQISVPQGQRVKALVSEGAIVRVYDSHMVEVPESTGTSSYMRSVIFTARISGSHYIEVVPEDAGVNTEYSLTLTNLEPSKYDDYETYREPPQTLPFPLSGFTGSIYRYSVGDNYYDDYEDSFRFKALIGQRLDLTIDFTPKLGESSGITIVLGFRNEDGYYIYSEIYETTGGPFSIGQVLPYSGYYTLQIYRFTGSAYNVDYELNGTLTYDNPAPYDILPHNVTVNKPTVIYADIPGADGATYYWEFSDGATPRASSQNKPTVTFSKAGQYSGRVTITNGGTPSVTDFSIQVDEWNREAIAAGDFYRGSSSLSLVIGDDDVMHVITRYSDYYYRDEGGWHTGPVLPEPIDMWDMTLSADSSDRPVAIGFSGNFLSLFTLNGPTWDIQMLGDTPIKAYHYYSFPKITRSQSGLLGVVCPSEGIREDGNSAIGLYCVWQTGTEWKSSFVGPYNYSYILEPNVAVSPSGVPYLCYRPYYDDIDPAASFSISHWDGSGWVKEDIIVPGEELAYTRTADIYFDAAEYPHIIFNNYVNKEICEAWKDGAEWRYETVLKASGSSWMNNWALDQDSQLMPWFVVLQSYDDGTNNGDMFVVHKEGSRWISEKVVSGVLLWDWMDLALDSNDNPHLVYTDNGVQVHAWRD